MYFSSSLWLCIFNAKWLSLQPVWGLFAPPPHYRLCMDTGRSQGLRVSFLPQVASTCWDRQEVSAPLCVNLFSSPWLKAAELPNPDHPPWLQLRESGVCVSVCVWGIFCAVFNLMSAYRICIMLSINKDNDFNLAFSVFKWTGNI